MTLWATLRTRRRFVEPLKGLDATAARWRARLKHAKLNVQHLHRDAAAVVDQQKEWNHLADAQLDERVVKLREVFARRNHEREHLIAGFAAVREIARREVGKQPYLVQIMGAMGLFHGQIVEMVTGEGKTLTASVGTTMLAWLRRPVHVITVNDYLAERDADEFNPVYRRAGLHAGFIGGETPEPQRMRAYRLPVVYLTQKELVADWLRDQLRLGRIADPVSTRWLMDNAGGRPHPAGQVLVPGLYAAVVDEADAVLIDEAVTPLIIAQPRGEDPQKDLYLEARRLGLLLTRGKHFSVDLRKRRVELTNPGREQLEELLGPEAHAIWRAIRRREELVTQALVAEHCYQHGQHYQIVEDKVVIVDEYTGRFMPDRQWQHGMHQAVEAKHGLEVTADRETVASLSFQRFFKMYPHLAGMTGTAADAKAEMETTYGLPVRVIPTNRPIQRVKMPDLIYATATLKWQAVVEEISAMHEAGRPVLVGTRSIEASEALSRMLQDRGLGHQVLNAVHHKAEAEIVAGAGQPGVVTVATNMAGRGTDIKLGTGVREAGGLHVILTERHTARRVDRQLFGRSGRQGDPGSARCIVSLEDDLLLKYAATASALMRRRYAGRRDPLPQWLKRVFDFAQARAQRDAFRSRAAVLKHDEELDQALPR
jgi:preprotein translocase subunit SecA